MKCLIDADILAYECAFAGQFKDELSGDLIMKDFDNVEDHLEMKLREIQEETFADEPPTLYLTGDNKLGRLLKRDFSPNFRIAAAVTKPYKGNRKSEKPLHFDNIRAFMLSRYDTIVADGCEADDMLAMAQTDKTVICSTDKDLRQIPGRHYSWSVGQRPSIPMYTVDSLGELKLIEGKTKKLWMTGMKCFYAQLLMGDVVDNIQGIPGVGPVGAYNLLNEATSELELYRLVRARYMEEWPEDGIQKLKEHAALIWIVRERKPDGSFKMYRPPKED